jgi:hypothetical protein
MCDIVKIARSQDSTVRVVAARLDSQEFESQQGIQIGSFFSQKCPD